MKEFDTHEFEQLCRQERKRIRTLQLNDQYTQTIQYNGRQYYYDPDWDCFYPVYAWEELSYWDRYGWLWTILVLTCVCLAITLVKS